MLENSRQPSATDAPPTTAATYFGLVIALFGLPIMRQIVVAIFSTIDLRATLWREALMWFCVAALFLLMQRERLPWRAIGLGTARLKPSLMWGGVITVVCAAFAIALSRVLPLSGKAGEAFSRLPIWLISLVVLRAGFAEELFYRGYAIERLNALGLHRVLAALIPLLIFAGAHWTGGWANVVIALVLGGILTAFYLWRRDLVANMIGHFMVDFIANVLPKVVG